MAYPSFPREVDSTFSDEISVLRIYPFPAHHLSSCPQASIGLHAHMGWKRIRNQALLVSLSTLGRVGWDREGGPGSIGGPFEEVRQTSFDQ